MIARITADHLRCAVCHLDWSQCGCIQLSESEWEAQKLAPYIHERILDPEPNTSERDGSVPVGIANALWLELVVAAVILLGCMWAKGWLPWKI